MSARMRSALGSVLVAAGVMLALLGMLVPGLAWAFYAGLLAGLTGIFFLALAIRATVREIGSAQTVFEARLRAEIGGKKGSSD